MRGGIILTGGIGSGKTTAGLVFRRLGAHVISADEAGHAVLAPGGEAAEAVAERWPDVVRDGAIDRGALASVVFGNVGELAALEAMTHPAISRRLAAAVEGSSAEVVMIETPVGSVFDVGWRRIVVDAPDEVRLSRLWLRGLTEDDARARMAHQPSRGEWLAMADLVVDNSGTLDDLESDCRRVWELIATDR
jgi:dephospho-CoA kinase